MEKTDLPNKTPEVAKTPNKAPAKLRGQKKAKRTNAQRGGAQKQPESWAWLLIKAGVMTAWTAAVILVVQFAIQYLVVWLLGRTTAVQPLPTAIMMALIYGLAFFVLLYLTPKIAVRKKGSLRHLLKERKYVRNIDVHIWGKTANREELGLRGWPTWTDIGLSIIGFIVAMLGAAIATALFSVFPWFNAEESQELGFATTVVGPERILAFVVLAIFVPIAEELIFRGWLYGRLRKMLDRKAPAWLGVVVSILLTSLLFGAMHGQWNVGVVTFVMSVVMCILREMTGTIYAGVLVHIIKNTLAFYQLYVIGVI